MADFKLNYTGAQVNQAIGNALNPSGGLYYHYIKFSSSANDYLCFICSESTPFTFSSLATWLYQKGFRSAQLFLWVVSYGGTYFGGKLFSTNGSSITHNNVTDSASTISSITSDTVIEL